MKKVKYLLALIILIILWFIYPYLIDYKINLREVSYATISNAQLDIQEIGKTVFNVAEKDLPYIIKCCESISIYRRASDREIPMGFPTQLTLYTENECYIISFYTIENEVSYSLISYESSNGKRWLARGKMNSDILIQFYSFLNLYC